jgi:L-ascorbate metabolism protein UlaG (beta-lactamase superfamily)
VKVTYFGHSSYLVESNGTSILIDPFNEKVGLPFPDVGPTAVVVTHEHFDHNNVQVAKGSPKVIRGLRDGGKNWAEPSEKVGPFTLSTIRTYHDTSQGAERGKNAMFLFEAEGLRLWHSGDLGHTLSQDQAKAAGRVDVLCIPVGGFYTIGPKEADVVIGQLSPRIVIPMHFKTEANKDWPIGTIDPFLERKERVQRLGRTITLSAGGIPKDQEIWVLRAA